MGSEGKPRGFLATISMNRQQQGRRQPVPGSGTHRRKLAVSGRNVEYLLHIPPEHSADSPVPLVLLLGEKAREHLRKGGWAAKADGVGLVVAALETVEADLLKAVYSEIAGMTRLDSNRLYLTGREAGAMAEVLTGVAAVAAVVSERTEGVPRGVHALARSGKPEAGPVWEFFDRHPRRPRPPIPTRLTVAVTRLRDDRGQVALALYRGADGFGNPAKAVAAVTAAIQGTKATTVFPALPPDDYALIALHDDNANGKMDVSFGFPQEGFAASNNPKPRFGAPTFADTRFYLAGDIPERRLSLRMIYL